MEVNGIVVIDMKRRVLPMLGINKLKAVRRSSDIFT